MSALMRSSVVEVGMTGTEVTVKEPLSSCQTSTSQTSSWLQEERVKVVLQNGTM
jgi:hypothetical protein